MRVALVVSGLPPYARSGVEVHGAALASALAAEGVEVEVCAPRPLPGLVPLAQRREERDGWAVTWLNVDPAKEPDEAQRAAAFAAFLDRERPDVVHFEDLERLGLRAVQEVENRGLPAVYSAHDWFALSDQTHLLAPDGEPFSPDDRELEARMALARERLREGQDADPSADLALVDELSRDDRERLQQLLRGDEDEPELARTRDEARARAERKKAAFNSFGGRYAATQHLARRLSATLGRAVDWRAPGIDPGPFAGSRTRQREDGGLRFGYFGALDRADGVHLLLEAFAGLEPGSATLVIHGDSDEREHLRRLRARARELNVEWGGPFRAEDTPGLLASVDVRLIPTLWNGGACFAALEAAAARRPVIAPHSEGLGDAVRDDVDGLLFDPGSVDSLGRVLRRFVGEEFLLDRFELELRDPRSIRLEAREWIDTYGELIKDLAERRPQPRIPAHAASFAKRYESLAKRSDRDLLGHVLAGIELLGEQMGLRSNPLDMLLLAVGRGSNLRDVAAADRHMIERLQGKVERLGSARTELEERAIWHGSQLDELRGRVEEREAALTKQKEVVEQARRDRDEIAAQKEADEEERKRLEERLGARILEAQGLEDELDTVRQAHGKLDEERGFLENTLEESARELRFLRERVAGEPGDPAMDDRDAIEQHFETLEKELSGLRDHEAWLRTEMGTLIGDLARSSGETASLEADPAGLELGRDGLERLVKELGWRREEMAAARSASQRLFARLTGGELATRARGWGQISS